MSLRYVGITACLVLGCSSPGQASANGDSGSQGAADAQGDPQACPPPPDSGDLPCDVSAVFQMRCQHCHTTPKLPPPNNAPFTLRSYEDVAAPFGITSMRRWQRVSQVIDPGHFPHMPPSTQPQLVPSDFATLHAWFAACAPAVPEGTGCDVGEDGGMKVDREAEAAVEAGTEAAVDAASDRVAE